jgi:hypothetical protein
MKDKILYPLVGIVCVVIMIFSVYIINKSPIDKETVAVKYIIGDRSGFDLNASALNFGMIQPGDSGTRSVVITNNRNFPIYVEFRTDKNLDGLLSFDRARQRIEPFTNFTFSVSIFIPKNATLGNYTGVFSALIFK